VLTKTYPESSTAVPNAISAKGWVRGAWRLVLLGAFFARALTEGAFLIVFRGRRFDHEARAAWLQKLARITRDIVGLEIKVTGELPQGGLVVCNHLSYLDIVVLGSVTPLAFLSKREVKNWPIIGRITAMAGTLYITREDPKEVVRLSSEFESRVASGIVVALFPEGTSSDGKRVLPFRSALLDPAVRHQWTVSPAWLGYEILDGSVGDEVCYWRDMTFFPHLLNLLTKEKISADLRFGPSVEAGPCRKELARKLQSHVCALGGVGSGFKEAHDSRLASV
jgi:1-acyl-sn-glycerol-3-phosphate acyltransferase